MNTKSLAFRLIVSSALWSLLVLGIASLLLSSNYRASIEKSFDERLQIHLKALVAEVSVREDKSLSVDKSLGDSRFEVPYSGWYWQIIDHKGRLAASSKSLFDARLTVKTPPGKDSTAIRFTYVSGPEGQNLRALSRPIILPEFKAAHHFLIAGNAEEIENEVDSFVRILGIGLVSLAFGMLAALFFQIKYGLRPLKEVQEALSNIRSGKEKTLPENTPSEISPLVTELNSLLKANQQVVERARTHVGNLAHSLKTPLSVLANEVNAIKPAAKKAKLAGQVEKMKNQITHHLDRAQMAARTRSFGLATEVIPVAQNILRALRQINKDLDLIVETDMQEGIVFAGEKQDLEEIVGNVLENAFKWANREIRLEIGRDTSKLDPAKPSQFMITIADDGPGLSPDDIKRALARGKRLDVSKPGSGLGLSIVCELIEIYGGEISLFKSQLGGLGVKISLPEVN